MFISNCGKNPVSYGQLAEQLREPCYFLHPHDCEMNAAFLFLLAPSKEV